MCVCVSVCLQGLIDEVAVWSRALTLVEHQALLNYDSVPLPLELFLPMSLPDSAVEGDTAASVQDVSGRNALIQALPEGSTVWGSSLPVCLPLGESRIACHFLCDVCACRTSFVAEQPVADGHAERGNSSGPCSDSSILASGTELQCASGPRWLLHAHPSLRRICCCRCSRINETLLGWCGEWCCVDRCGSDIPGIVNVGG